MSIFKTLSSVVSDLFKPHSFDLVDIEMPVNDVAWRTKSGAIMSIIEIRGSAKLVGSEEFEETVINWSKVFGAALEDGSFDFQMVYERDKDYTKRDLDRIYQGHRSSAKALRLDVEDLIEEEQKVFEELSVYERLYLAIWTRPSTSSSDGDEEEGTKDDSDSMAALKELGVINKDGVALFGDNENLIDNHKVILNTVTDLFTNCGFIFETLNQEEMLNVMFSQAERHTFSDGVSLKTFAGGPISSGSKYYPTRYSVDQDINDMTDIILPRFDQQIVRSTHYRRRLDGRPLDEGQLRVGNVVYWPKSLSVWPRNLARFNKLFAKIDDSIPYRLSFRWCSDSDTWDVLKGLVTTFTSVLSDKTRNIKEHRTYLAELAGSDSFKAAVQVSVCTWASDVSELYRRSNSLENSFLQWEGAKIESFVPNPSHAFLANCIGISSIQPGPIVYAPIDEFFYHLPIARPGDVWRDGAVVLKTNCGKLWCYEPGSTKQESNNMMIIARPRMGKSLLSNAINFVLSMKRGNVRLPYVYVSDIGMSALGYILAIKDSLPEDEKHLVFAHKLQMDKKAPKLNPFDLELGCEEPLPYERDNIKNFLVTLTTEPGDDRPPAGMVDFVNAVIESAYKKCSDRITAKRFKVGINKEVDDELERLGIDTSGRLTWWDIRDFFFDNGEVRLAVISQRYCVPTLEMLSEVVNSDQQLSFMYGPESGDNLITKFMRKITSAISDYPIYNGVTELDFSNARIVSFDLNDVAVQGDDADSRRKNAISYIMTTYFGTKHYFLTLDSLLSFQPKYRAYQEKRINEIREDEKRIVCDEAHRAKDPGVQRMFSIFQREGGKWGVQICLISHNIKDFSEEVVKNSNTYIFLGSFPKSEVENIDEMIGLTKTERSVFLSDVMHGPKQGGSSLLMRFTTVDGTFSQLLRFPRGPKLLWSLSTTVIDMAVRRQIYDIYGKQIGRAILAKEYPLGNTKVDIERIRQEMSDSVMDGDTMDEKAGLSIAQRLTHDLKQKYTPRVVAQMFAKSTVA